MKNIKTYIIGFLSCACLFLFIGATDSKEESQAGKYQAFAHFEDGKLYIIDTSTGEMWFKKKRTNYWERCVAPNDFRVINK